MNWTKEKIENDFGEIVNAQTPVIISASRSTDIPAFYADWFVERWKKGYIKWTNPFNGVPLYVSFKKARVVVFWTKNPKPMMKYLPFLQEQVKNFYFQFTLNDYDKEGYEGNVPGVEHRIKTFIELSKAIGKEKVIWRFDPMILTDKIDVDKLLARVKNIGDQLKEYTNKLVFSFADISTYKKVENNLKREGIAYQEFTEETMHQFAQGLQKLNKIWGFEIGTCAEKIPLEQYGIIHNKCVDDDLMINLFNKDKELMEFLGVKIIPADLLNPEPRLEKTRNNKDKGQRELCGCIVSKDIGQYNTCPHECVYCYANTSIETARKNYKTHKLNTKSETIIGD
jgi:DNA repair photolyase